MKEYNKNGQLETIMYNCCGKRLVIQQGIVRKECISIDHVWDYSSEKGRQIHHFDSYGECYGELVSDFKIPVGREEQTKFLWDGIGGTAKAILFNMYPRISYGGYGEIFRKAVSVQRRNLSLDKGHQVTRHFPGNVVA